jgi:hypothetical protein
MPKYIAVNCPPFANFFCEKSFKGLGHVGMCKGMVKLYYCRFPLNLM